MARHRNAAVVTLQQVPIASSTDELSPGLTLNSPIQLGAPAKRHLCVAVLTNRLTIGRAQRFVGVLNTTYIIARIIVWSADKLAEGASAVALNLSVSTLVIGITIIGFGTSAPKILI